MIPVSTTLSDPKWYHDFTKNYNYVFKDKRGIYNGIRAADLHFVPREGEEVECGPACVTHDPTQCNFLKQYREHLNEIDFQGFIKECERVANEIQQREGFEEEPYIVLIFYEIPSNKCSERDTVQTWFKDNGYEISELKYPI